MIQNLNHIEDIRHKNNKKKTDKNFANLKIDINKTIRRGALIQNFEDIYNVIMKALKLKKSSQNFNDLFMPKIYNTISINSPHYETLNYKQINIFNDPIHEEMLKHESSLPLNQIKIDFSNMFIDYKEINYIGKIQNQSGINNNNKNNEGKKKKKLL